MGELRRVGRSGVVGAVAALAIGCSSSSGSGAGASTAATSGAGGGATSTTTGAGTGGGATGTGGATTGSGGAGGSSAAGGAGGGDPALAVDVVASIDLGCVPLAVAADAANHVVYAVCDLQVPAYDKGQLVAIDTTTDTVKGKVELEHYGRFAIDPAAKRAFVLGSNIGGGFVSVVDLGSMSVAATWSIGPNSDVGSYVAVDPAAHRVYALVGQSVIVADEGSGAVAATIALPFKVFFNSGEAWPQGGVALDATKKRLYVQGSNVANPAKAPVAVIDTGTGAVTSTTPYDGDPRGIQAWEGNAFALTSGTAAVQVLDPQTVALPADFVPDSFEPTHVSSMYKGPVLRIWGHDATTGATEWVDLRVYPDHLGKPTGVMKLNAGGRQFLLDTAPIDADGNVYGVLQPDPEHSADPPSKFVVHLKTSLK
jgi:hypothetical protein